MMPKHIFKLFSLNTFYLFLINDILKKLKLSQFGFYTSYLFIYLLPLNTRLKKMFVIINFPSSFLHQTLEPSQEIQKTSPPPATLSKPENVSVNLRSDTSLSLSWMPSTVEGEPVSNAVTSVCRVYSILMLPSIKHTKGRLHLGNF